MCFCLNSCNNSKNDYYSKGENLNLKAEFIIGSFTSYYDEIYELSEISKSYIDTLTFRSDIYLNKNENPKIGNVVYLNNQVFHIPEQIISNNEKEKLVSFITNMDSTAYVWIVIPFKKEFDFNIISDSKLSNSLEMNLEDGEWSNIYDNVKEKTKFRFKQKNKPFSISINTEYVTFEPSKLNIKLEMVKPQWLNYQNKDGKIEGTIIFYREKIDGQEEDLEISVWLPHRNLVKK